MGIGKAANGLGRQPMGPQPAKRIGEVLVESGVITEGQLQEALAAKKGTNRRLGMVLVDMGLATESEICRALARQQGLEMVDLTTVVPEPQAIERVPSEIALKHYLIPLKYQNGRLQLAMADPLDMAGYDAAWRAAKCATVDRVVAPESEVAALIQEFYGGPSLAQESLKGLMPTEQVAIMSDMPTQRSQTGRGKENRSIHAMPIMYITRKAINRKNTAMRAINMPRPPSRLTA